MNVKGRVSPLGNSSERSTCEAVKVHAGLTGGVVLDAVEFGEAGHVRPCVEGCGGPTQHVVPDPRAVAGGRTLRGWLLRLQVVRHHALQLLRTPHYSHLSCLVSDEKKGKLLLDSNPKISHTSCAVLFSTNLFVDGFLKILRPCLAHFKWIQK